MEYEAFALVDDGPEGTALQCRYCGATIHTSPEPPDDPKDDWDRLSAAVDLAEYHLDECPALVIEEENEDEEENEIEEENEDEGEDEYGRVYTLGDGDDDDPFAHVEQSEFDPIL